MNIIKRQLNEHSIIIATIIGSFFEYFDFMVFVFSADIIAELFFPKTNYFLSLMYTYLTITISYIFRPIGGVVMGIVSDRYGRKVVLYISMLLMAVPSFLIGLLPTYSQIGIASSILLVLLRTLQGISLGGEVPASITYIYEKYRHKNYFIYCAWLTFGANIGIFCASRFTSTLYGGLSKDVIMTVGWRIPFIIAGVLAFISLYIKKFASESPAFVESKETNHTKFIPPIVVLKKYFPQLICGISMCMVVSLSTFVFLIFIPSLSLTNGIIDNHTRLEIIGLGSLTLGIASLFFAYISSIINPARILKTSLISLVFILYWVLYTNIHVKMLGIYSYNIFYLVSFVIPFFIAGINGLFFGFLADMFPTEVRFSGVSICYNLAYLFGAGLTPIWGSWLMKYKHGAVYIIGIVMLVILLVTFTFKINSKFNKH
jgi:MFS family permease